MPAAGEDTKCYFLLMQGERLSSIDGRAPPRWFWQFVLLIGNGYIPIGRAHKLCQQNGH